MEEGGVWRCHSVRGSEEAPKGKVEVEWIPVFTVTSKGWRLEGGGEEGETEGKEEDGDQAGEEETSW